MNIRERINILIEYKGKMPKEMEELTGTDRASWSNIKRKSIRANTDHIEGVISLWPEFSYWITTGKTIPEAGQISPEIDAKKRELNEDLEAEKAA